VHGTNAIKIASCLHRDVMHILGSRRSLRSICNLVARCTRIAIQFTPARNV